MTVTKKQARNFGKAVGAAPITLTRTSVADLGVRNNPSGVMPIGLCQYQANTIINHAASDALAGLPHRTELITLSKVWTGNQTCDGVDGSGNWGWLDLGQGNGANALGDLIAAGGTTAEVTVTGNPPDPGAQRDAGQQGQQRRTCTRACPRSWTRS